MMQGERIRTWGEVALLLGVSVRTAQRYHARIGLPLRKACGGRTAPVVAIRAELLAWLDRCERPLPRPVA